MLFKYRLGEEYGKEGPSVGRPDSIDNGNEIETSNSPRLSDSVSK